ncbi:HEAT repeat domain-containing protein [Kitasatospora sp. NPDC089913]|uniref:HEAT repeat domain-containing protein n=1 Tax=Kitasatospora sp. NPDC089913 TaxID=3364080 RepID=UPI003819F7C7
MPRTPRRVVAADPSMRVTALVLLARRRPTICPAAERARRDESTEVRVRAVRLPALLWSANPRPRALLQELAEDDDEALREVVAEALEPIGTDAAGTYTG